MAPIEVEPTATRNVLESLGVGLLVLTFTALYGKYNRGFGWTESFAIAAAAFVFAVGFYSIRFMRKGLKNLRLHDEGLDATMRDGSVVRLVWARIKEATLTDSYGGMWLIRFGGGELKIRDDGFTIDEWDEVTARIQLEMAQVGKESTVQGLQQFFMADAAETLEKVSNGVPLSQLDEGEDWSNPWAPPEELSPPDA